MVKEDGAGCDHRRHPGDSAEKKVERNLPRPDWWFDHGLTIVTGSVRNRTAGNIDAFARNDALFPRLLAQLFESLLGWRVTRHEKNAKAASVAMIDAIAVANAENHAD